MSPETDIHVVLNGSDWYDNDTMTAALPSTTAPAASLCAARTLDVKATEDDSFPLFELAPGLP